MHVHTPTLRNHTTIYTIHKQTYNISLKKTYDHTHTHIKMHILSY
jgi:hypothetical protein